MGDRPRFYRRHIAITCAFVAFAGSCASMQSPFEQAQRRDTTAAYEEYLQEYRYSPDADQALNRLLVLSFGEAERLGSAAALQSAYERVLRLKPRYGIRAEALRRYEEGLMKGLRQHGPGSRLILAEFQPQGGGCQFGFTISSISPGLYELTLESLGDKLSFPAWPRLCPQGDGSVVRFQGDIPFPLELDAAPTPGTMVTGIPGKPFGFGTLERNPGPIRQNVQGQSLPKAVVFHGDDATHPLSFGLVEGIGLVHLHGTGRITLSDGSVVPVADSR